MKRTLAIVATTLTLFAGGAIIAAPSQAATPKPWMTKKEFRYIYVGEGWGDTVKEVRRWVGGKGTLTYSSSWYEPSYCDIYNYDYTACLVYGGGITHTYKTYAWRTSRFAKYGASISFSDGHAVTKSFYR